MTTQLVTCPLKTHPLTAMSNVTSITVTGHQVSILEMQPEPGEEDKSAVHLTFDVEHPHQLPSLLSTAEELGLIMDRDDAVEISLSVLAMAMANKSSTEIAAMQKRLANRIAELQSSVIPEES
jgi:hypothetical protein